jgi:hypothetical protein
MDFLSSTYVGGRARLEVVHRNPPLTFNHSCALEWWQFVPVKALFVPNICRLYLGGGDRSPLEARSIEFWTLFFGETRKHTAPNAWKPASQEISIWVKQYFGATVVKPSGVGGRRDEAELSPVQTVRASVSQRQRREPDSCNKLASPSLTRAFMASAIARNGRL